MTRAVCDASVAFKWLHTVGEEGVEDARQVLAACRSRRIELVALELIFYELGNALSNTAGVSAKQTEDHLDAVAVLWPKPRRLSPLLRTVAAHLAESHGLSYYDRTPSGAGRRRQVTPTRSCPAACS